MLGTERNGTARTGPGSPASGSGGTPELGGGTVEFTIGRRVGRRGAGLLCAAGAGAAALVAWLVLHGVGGTDGAAGPVVAVAAIVLVGWRGVWEVRRARRPFRLRVDGFGITLHDAELSWEQIDRVALRYRSAGDDESAPPKPHLTVWLAPGVTLPRRPDRTLGTDTRYALVDTDDLDQDLGDLTAVLAAYGGDRFEAVPRAVRPPMPVTVAGPEGRVPYGERVFRETGPAGPLALLCAVVAVAATAPFVAALAAQAVVLPVMAFPALVAPAALGWYGLPYFYGRWRRPRQLAVGPHGIGAREAGRAGIDFAWADVAAVTVGPRADSADKRPWLVVWPLPGTHLPAGSAHLADGHLACPLIRLDRIPGGPDAALPALHAFAGERFTAAPAP